VIWTETLLGSDAALSDFARNGLNRLLKRWRSVDDLGLSH
jgi:hypothetical protein